MGAVEEVCAECGLSPDDIYHEGFHGITLWNREAFKRAREKAMAEFERRINPRSKSKSGTSKSKSKQMPTL